MIFHQMGSPKRGRATSDQKGRRQTRHRRVSKATRAIHHERELRCSCTARADDRVLRVRGNWSTGFLDCKLPEASGDFLRFLQEQHKLPVGICGKPFSPVCSRRFPKRTGARTPYSSTLLVWRRALRCLALLFSAVACHVTPTSKLMKSYQSSSVITGCVERNILCVLPSLSHSSVWFPNCC